MGQPLSKLFGLILSGDGTWRQELEFALHNIKGFDLTRCTQKEPGESELANPLDVYEPHLVFVDTKELRRALRVAAYIRQHSSKAQIAAVASSHDAEAVLSAETPKRARFSRSRHEASI